MIEIFESLLPIFLLILIGAILKRIQLIKDDQWIGLERISFYVFFPALLINVLYKTELTSISASGSALGFALTLFIIFVFGFVIKTPTENLFGLSSASYSSVFQGFTRWNAFIALAIAEKIANSEALAIIAIGISVMVIPINIVNIYALARWGDKGKELRNPSILVIQNPLVIGALIGLAINLIGIKLYEPIEVTIDLASRVSLPLGLILVGAGLRFIMPRKTFAAVVLSTFLKLIALPGLFVATGLMMGVVGNDLVAMAIAGSVPTAMNGYVIARDMGGDAPLYAGIVTLQVFVAFFTIPLVVLLATYYAG